MIGSVPRSSATRRHDPFSSHCGPSGVGAGAVDTTLRSKSAAKRTSRPSSTRYRPTDAG